DAERRGLSMWQDVRRFGIDPASLSKEQRSLLIQELRRYEGALIVVDFAGQAALKSCDAALR
ncbi:MAG TPA: hypothetical protein VGD54_02145, partial [Steroidobacteraceae bacterium]